LIVTAPRINNEVPYLYLFLWWMVLISRVDSTVQRGHRDSGQVRTTQTHRSKCTVTVGLDSLDEYSLSH